MSWERLALNHKKESIDGSLKFCFKEIEGASSLAVYFENHRYTGGVPAIRRGGLKSFVDTDRGKAK